MATTVTLNGSSYSVPSVSDSYGTSLSNYLIALSTGVLSKAGGTFTLTADTDFGATYGLKSTYYKSRNSNPSASGIVRLGNNESLAWRNQANNADLTLTAYTTNRLQYAGVDVPTISSTDTLTNKSLSGSANTFTNLPYTALSSMTSAQLAGIVSDETGSGALVFGTSPTIATPTITTSLTGPLVIGGTGTTSTLTLQTTSGVGTTNADMLFKVGNNGATEAMRILNSGLIGIGNTDPGYPITVTGAASSSIGQEIRLGSGSTVGGLHITDNTGATEYGFLTSTSSLVKIGTNKASSGLEFHTNGAVKASIDSSGNFNVAGLTASYAVVTDGSKNLASLQYTSAATASTIVSRDSNANSVINNLSVNYTTTASSAGTLTLTVSSARKQYITGTSSHTVKLPDATTLSLGFEFEIKNNSTSTTGVSIVNNGSTQQAILAYGSVARCVCTSIGSSNGTWDINVSGGQEYTPTNVGVNSAITALTPYATRYQQVNGNITVSGFINVQASATTGSNFSYSLPLAYNITSLTQLSGSGTQDNAGGTTRVPVLITGDSTNDGAIFYVTAPSTSTSNLSFIYNYKVY